ncbi:MAG: DNA-binding protein WhiA [Clostridia bacterium]|nr:DNA-binding protein WhiA [Clostridia bacterium]
MSNISFGKQTKEALLKIEPKKKCCKKTYSSTFNALSAVMSETATVSDAFEGIKCEVCLREFLRAAFMVCGSVTDPSKRYHLDFSSSDKVVACYITMALEKSGFTPGHSKRKNCFVIYFKDSDTISDFLAYIGATSAAFEIMNGKILKEVRNNANRLVNCDTANIEKILSASQKYVEAIEYIKLREAMSTLPSELREVSELRLQYSQASLNELASKCEPPITKSGLKHRLEKILKYAEELKNGES